MLQKIDGLGQAPGAFSISEENNPPTVVSKYLKAIYIMTSASRKDGTEMPIKARKVEYIAQRILAYGRINTNREAISQVTSTPPNVTAMVSQMRSQIIKLTGCIY